MKKKTEQLAEKESGTYSFAFKKQVIDEIENGLISMNRATHKYHLHRSTLQRWFDKFGNFEKRMYHMGTKTPKQEIIALKRKVKVLEQEKEILQIAMDILKEDFGVEIEKKYLPESQKRIKTSKGKQ